MSGVNVTPGRIVNYVLPVGRSAGQVRPMIVTRVWEGSTGVNGQLFTDGSNDGPEYAAGVAWVTSVSYSEEKLPGTWHLAGVQMSGAVAYALLNWPVSK